MSINSGLQTKEWNGYFDKNIDTIIGSWHYCDICHRIPTEIYHDSESFYTIWHCMKCKPEDYKPKNWVESFLIWVDKKCNNKKR